MNFPVQRKMCRLAAQKGQSVVEFALLVPFLLILMMGIIEFGYLINCHVSVANATREGARAAALGRTPTQVNSAVIASSGAVVVTSSNITVQKSTDGGTTWTTLGTTTYTSGSTITYNNAAGGDLVRVTVSVQFQQLTNFIPGLNNHMITKVVVMRREAT